MTISLDRLQQFYGELSAPLLLRAMIREEFAGRIALLTSFGADAGLLLSMVAETDHTTPILFLDTCKHFPETLEYAQTLKLQLGLSNVHYLKPDAEMTQRVDPDGDLWKTQPNRCCWLRKVEPLQRAIRELKLEALITGRKRYQTKERAEMQTIERDEDGIIRINPLAFWTKEQQRETTQKLGLHDHPLIARGYKSIGCEPCTKPVAEGQDERAGRWAHTIGIENEQKAECGIHIPAAATDWSV